METFRSPSTRNEERPIGKFPGDTSIGGAPGVFPNTTWGLISRCCDGKGEAPRADLEILCRRYWKPVYRYVRMVWAKTNDDAKDLSQAFFLWLIEGEALKKYAPGRGSFRRYLKVLLGSFVNDQEKALNRLKRGGGTRILPIDDGEFAIGDTVADAQAASPEKEFDRAWAVAVARHAIDRVREKYAADGRANQFQVYEIYDLSPQAEKPTYAEVASRIGGKEGDVRHYLSWVRAAVHAELRAELARLMTDPGDLEEEWNALFGS